MTEPENRKPRAGAARGGPGEHPRGGAALRERVLGERGRIARLSRIRELMLGFQDGLLVPLGVVTSLAGASLGSTPIIIGGLAEAAAGALAMGTGSFLASQAENQLFKSEIAAEEAELADHPEIERAELELLLGEEGLEAEDARRVSELIARSPCALVKTKIEKELGPPYGEVETAVGDAFVVGLPTRSPRSSRCGRTSSGRPAQRFSSPWRRPPSPCSGSASQRDGWLAWRSSEAVFRSWPSVELRPASGT